MFKFIFNLYCQEMCACVCVCHCQYDQTMSFLRQCFGMLRPKSVKHITKPPHFVPVHLNNLSGFRPAGPVASNSPIDHTQHLELLCTLLLRVQQTMRVWRKQIYIYTYILSNKYELNTHHTTSVRTKHDSVIVISHTSMFCINSSYFILCLYERGIVLHTQNIVANAAQASLLLGLLLCTACIQAWSGTATTSSH